MKKIFMFLAIAGTALFGSCSDDDSSAPVAKSIVVTSNVATVQVGGSFTFTVTNDLTKNVTAASEIFVNNVKITGATYTPTAAGTFTVKAVNGALTSPEITVTATTVAGTSIVLTSNVDTVTIGGSFTFTVKNNLTADVTSTSQISVNGSVITGNTYTPAAVGSYTVHAVNGTLTSPDVVVTVTAFATTPSDSFIINGTNYATPLAGYGFKGIFQTTETSGVFFIEWDFNVVLSGGTESNPTTPNAIIVTTRYAITPSGTDPDTGDPTFTIAPPTPGTITWDDLLPSPEIGDLLVVANNQALLSDDPETRFGQISAVNFNLASVTFPANQGDASNVQATYTVNLTDGKTINGEYSGSVVVFDARPDAEGRTAAKGKFAKLTKFKNVKLSKGVKPFKLK